MTLNDRFTSSASRAISAVAELIVSLYISYFLLLVVVSYGTQSDMWASGCVLYELCTHDRPFKGSTLSQLIMNIMRGKYSPISK